MIERFDEVPPNMPTIYEVDDLAHGVLVWRSKCPTHRGGRPCGCPKEGGWHRTFNDSPGGGRLILPMLEVGLDEAVDVYDQAIEALKPFVKQPLCIAQLSLTRGEILVYTALQVAHWVEGVSFRTACDRAQLNSRRVLDEVCADDNSSRTARIRIGMFASDFPEFVSLSPGEPRPKWFTKRGPPEPKKLRETAWAHVLNGLQLDD